MMRGFERGNPRGAAMSSCREAAGLSIAELAELSGVGSSTISRWELGRVNSSLEAVLLVCDVLGVSVDTYIGRTKIPQAELPKKPKATWDEFLCFARDPEYGDHTAIIMYLCSRCGRMQSEKTSTCACGADMRGGGEKAE